MKDPRAFSPVRIRRVFLRLLGVAHLVAFASFWIQVEGLFGERGILPVEESLREIEGFVPSVLAIAPGDASLHAVCAAGVACAALLVAGIVPRLALALLWILQLSLVSIGGSFTAIQSDALLLETTFLAFFLASGDEPPAAPLWMLRWLLFRLVFFSGLAKVLGRDPVWWNLTALAYHFETQPLPLWTAWYAHHLPDWAQRLAAASALAVELFAPWLYLGGPWARRAGAAATAILQVLIAATGSYGLLNVLALLLAALLLDDGPSVRRARWELRHAPLIAVFLVLPLVGAPPEVARFRTVNEYGAFGRMTTERWEVVVEGTAGGEEWRAYSFRAKPDDVYAAPRFLFGHLPRLDWRLWFVPLSRRGIVRNEPWLERFLDRLLEGSEPVRGLLASDPFPGEPPRQVRAVLYRYRFTEPGATEWWIRERGEVVMERSR